MMAEQNEITFLLIVTTGLWAIQMVVSIAIKEYGFSEQASNGEIIKENQDLFIEVVTKVLGIVTVLCAYWILLVCSRRNQMITLQLLFFFVSLFFAGDYGVPSAYFVELLHRRNDEDLKLLQRNPLYKKTWSHNVVFQTGIYVLFLLVIYVESSQHFNPTSVREANSAEVSSTSSATSQSHFLERWVSAITYNGIINFSRFCIVWMWPLLLAIVIVWYTHKMDIHLITTIFYTCYLCLMVFIRWQRHSHSTWSCFYRQYHPAEENNSPLITLGLFSKTSVYGLTFLFASTLYSEITSFTGTNILAVGFFTLSMLLVTVMLHMSNLP